MQIDNINSLIAKYTEGETTVAEEEQLRNFFAQDPLLVPNELRPFCALFRWEQQERCKQVAKQNGFIGQKQTLLKNINAYQTGLLLLFRLLQLW